MSLQLQRIMRVKGGNVPGQGGKESENKTCVQPFVKGRFADLMCQRTNNIGLCVVRNYLKSGRILKRLPSL